MIAPTLLIACVVLIAGTYLSRVAGVLIGARKRDAPEDNSRRRARADGYLDHAVACLLAAVVVTSIISPTGSEPPLVAGVAVGAILAWNRYPLPLTVLAATATTALLRAIS